MAHIEVIGSSTAPNKQRSGTTVINEDVNIIKQETTVASRSSPDSSTDLSSLSCPQCSACHRDEMSLINHLWSEHHIRLVSNGGGGATAGPTTTRCPVCRQQVSDLSQHFALQHSEQQRNNNRNNNQQQIMLKPDVTSIVTTRTIPIILPNQPVPPGQLIKKEVDLDRSSPAPSSPLNTFNSSSSNSSNSILNSPTHNNNHHHYQQQQSVSIIPLPGKSCRPILPSHHSNDNPMNLSVKRDLEEEDDEYEILENGGGGRKLDKKRRKQTHVPETNKDERYWARRIKNNEAAKRSRDMRIKREKVIFEENMRLESMVKHFKSENEKLSTENKELHLKLDFIMDENARLKQLVKQEEEEEQQQQQHFHHQQ